MLGPSRSPVPMVADDRARLDRLVDGWWSGIASGGGTVVPDGAVDLLLVPGRAPFLAGPDVAPRPVDLPAGVPFVGVRLRPGVAAQLLGDGVDRVVGRQVPLDAVWSHGALERLYDDLGPISPSATGEPAGLQGAARAATLARAIDRQVPADWQPDRATLGAMAAIAAGRPQEGIDLGSRQLRRRFTAAIGYGPALFRRISRLDRFTDLLAIQPDRSLAELAAAAGFFDQAHLGRDCRQLLGITPGELRPPR